MKSRPAETSAVAAAVALLIGYFAGIKDTEVVLALAVVIGFVPAAVTWAVTTFRRPRGQGGFTAVELLLALILAALLVALALGWNL